MSDELKACPFCYPHPACDEYPPYITQEIADSGAWCVHAPCCDFYGPLSSTKEEAARKWNTRAQLPSQGGEAVEVVAYHGIRPDSGEGFVGARWPNAFGQDCIVEPLMTVAQHQRIVADLTANRDALLNVMRARKMLPKCEPSLDAELVALLQDASQWFADRDSDINLARDIDAKLASMEVKS